MKRFRCKTCGNETEFTIWRPIAEYDAATGDFVDAYMPAPDKMECDECSSNNIEELPVIANKV